MHEQNTAVATIESGPETESAMTVRNDSRLAAFRAKVEEEKGMREILAVYVRDAMVAGHHHYTIGTAKDAKPALSQEGAHAIFTLLNATPGKPEKDETYHEDGHYSVTVSIEVKKSNGESVFGDGSCTTRESKYAYRWCWTNELPVGIDKESLKKRGKLENPQYQLPNPDLPDVYNTVLKMAVKRAKVAAARCLPGVSEIFVAEAAEDMQDRIDNSSNQPPARGQNRKTEPKPPANSPAPPSSGETPSKTVQRLVGRLIDLGMPLEEIEEDFKPADVKSFDTITDAAAEPIVSDLVAKVNTKLKENK